MYIYICMYTVYTYGYFYLISLEDSAGKACHRQISTLMARSPDPCRAHCTTDALRSVFVSLGVVQIHQIDKRRFYNMRILNNYPPLCLEHDVECLQALLSLSPGC